MSNTPSLLRDAEGRALPELSMAVLEHARRLGVGGRLVEALAREATGRHDALVLNVHLLNTPGGRG